MERESDNGNEHVLYAPVDRQLGPAGFRVYRANALKVNVGFEIYSSGFGVP